MLDAPKARNHRRGLPGLLGLWLLVNHAHINNVIYLCNASGTQFTFILPSKHYRPEYAAAVAVFDLDKANALLDEMSRQRTVDTPFLRRPKYFASLDGDESCWGTLWGQWYTSAGESGEEPPQIIKDLFEWHDLFNLTYSAEYPEKVLSSQAEHIWTIGSVGNAPHPLFVRNNMRNVSETGG